jgi:hypothetical protein
VSEADEQTRTAEQIEADIERTRRELADTVEALAEKTDVKAQAKAKANEAKENVSEKADHAAGVLKTDRRAQVLIGLGGAVAIVLLVRRVRS